MLWEAWTIAEKARIWSSTSSSTWKFEALAARDITGSWECNVRCSFSSFSKGVFRLYHFEPLSGLDTLIMLPEGWDEVWFDHYNGLLFLLFNVFVLFVDDVKPKCNCNLWDGEANLLSKTALVHGKWDGIEGITHEKWWDRTLFIKARTNKSVN